MTSGDTSTFFQAPDSKEATVSNIPFWLKHTHTHTHTHARAHPRTHARTHTHTHARTYVRTHTLTWKKQNWFCVCSRMRGGAPILHTILANTRRVISLIFKSKTWFFTLKTVSNGATLNMFEHRARKICLHQLACKFKTQQMVKKKRKKKKKKNNNSNNILLIGQYKTSENCQCKHLFQATNRQIIFFLNDDMNEILHCCRCLW